MHLDEGLRVADPAPYAAEHRTHVDPTMDVLLVDGPHFRLAQLAGKGRRRPPDGFAGAALLMAIEGEAVSERLRIAPGQAACVDSDRPIDLSDDARALIAQPIG